MADKEYFKERDNHKKALRKKDELELYFDMRMKLINEDQKHIEQLDKINMIIRDSKSHKLNDEIAMKKIYEIMEWEKNE